MLRSNATERIRSTAILKRRNLLRKNFYVMILHVRRKIWIKIYVLNLKSAMNVNNVQNLLDNVQMKNCVHSARNSSLAKVNVLVKTVVKLTNAIAREVTDKTVSVKTVIQIMNVIFHKILADLIKNIVYPNQQLKNHQKKIKNIKKLKNCTIVCKKYKLPIYTFRNL